MAKLGQARLNVMRLNAARLNVYRAVYTVEINGVARKLRIAAATITHQLNHLPDTAHFRMSGYVPTAGERIEVWCGQRDPDHQLFGGRILSATGLYEGERPALVAYDVECIDPTWLLNRDKVIWRYIGQSATVIVLSIIGSFSRGVTTVNVVAGLPVIDEITFTNEDVADALSRVADRIGGYWYVDYQGDLHFFLDEGKTAAPITQAAPRTSRAHTLEEDLSQVANFVKGRGGGGVALVDVPGGATSIPVDEPIWYQAGGGRIESGPQVITYTGIASSEGGGNVGSMSYPGAEGGGSPWGTFRVEAVNNSSWVWAAGRYYIAITNVKADGSETTPWQFFFDLPAASNAIWLTPKTKPDDPALVNFRVYCTTTPNDSALTTQGNIGGSNPSNNFTPWAIINNAPPSNIVTIGSVTNIGARGPKPPTINTAGFSAIPIPAGATSVMIDELTPFLASGWAVAPGDQVFRYTGKSAPTGSGTLTGIPSSGYGSITAPMRSGTIRNVAHIIGIPASGAGQIYFTIKQGDELNIEYELVDWPAVDAMQSRLGLPAQADGIFKSYLDDGRYAYAELAYVVNATLRDRKTPQQTVRFESRDDSLQIGRTVAINLTTPIIVGTYRIQQIQFSEIAIGGGASTLLPLRTVTASNKLYSFADILRTMRG